MEQNKKYLLVVNSQKDQSYTYSQKCIDFLCRLGVEVFVEVEAYSYVKHAKVATIDDLKNMDMAVVLGGDGTILNTANKYKSFSLPIFGINLGRVGCLAVAEVDNAESCLTEVIEGNYHVEERITLSGTILHENGKKETFLAYNEATLSRGSRLKMLAITVSVLEKGESTFYADGVIVSTPTGSSAYNLSSGGPLLLATANSYVITPICAQLKTITSLVVSDQDVICLSIVDESYKEPYDKVLPNLDVDGRCQYGIHPTDKILLKKSSKKLRIVKTNQKASLYEPIYKITLAK